MKVYVTVWREKSGKLMGRAWGIKRNAKPMGNLLELEVEDDVNHYVPMDPLRLANTEEEPFEPLTEEQKVEIVDHESMICDLSPK